MSTSAIALPPGATLESIPGLKLPPGATLESAPGAPPSVPKPQVDMQSEPLSAADQFRANVINNAKTAAGIYRDFGTKIANDVADVSAPNIATQVYRKLKGKANTLDQIPEKALLGFLAAGGLPESEIAEAGAARSADAGAAKAAPAPAAAAAPKLAPGQYLQATPEEAAEAAPKPTNLDMPRPVSGEGALRKVLTGQDNANLLKIARARGINVSAESQLKPGVGNAKLISKIVDDFSDDELDNLRSTYIENSAFRHNFGDIGPEAQKTLAMRTYFPEVNVPQAVLNRTAAAIKSAPSATAAAADEDLTSILQESLRRVQQQKAEATQ
jgi:hypothetical protein